MSDKVVKLNGVDEPQFPEFCEVRDKIIDAQIILDKFIGGMFYNNDPLIFMSVKEQDKVITEVIDRDDLVNASQLFFKIFNLVSPKNSTDVVCDNCLSYQEKELCK
jgi:hypothetical protein